MFLILSPYFACGYNGLAEAWGGGNCSHCHLQMCLVAWVMGSMAAMVSAQNTPGLSATLPVQFKWKLCSQEWALTVASLLSDRFQQWVCELGWGSPQRDCPWCGNTHIVTVSLPWAGCCWHPRDRYLNMAGWHFCVTSYL